MLAAALAIGRKMDTGELDLELLAEIVATLRDEAAEERAARLRDYVGGTGPGAAQSAFRALAAEFIHDGSPSLRDVRARLETTRYACV